ncbi:KRI1-like family C-terminal-domain-containing protein [Mycena pura]|uniref:KRI1-like family C-terminal-domain-containing protein n=1 Tax=Mycena pura TaxID=153505 RepID=A0AAD6V1W8_9AGAR|nr:KRI1-like family C-terminal-domain-containing protein [Mycena pura]
MLSDSDSESANGRDLHQLAINEHYAKAFEYRKEREELQRLKEQYGSDPEEDGDETDSESLESEDSDGEELTPAMDAAILRTLARIKRKDPEIYKDGKDIFGEEQEKTAQSAKTSLTRPAGPVKAPKDKGKSWTIRAANLQNALLSRSPSPERVDPQPTHVEEQRRLRAETIAAFHATEGDEESDDDWLIPREKTMNELAGEEQDYRQFLEAEVGDLRGLVDVGGDAPVIEPPQEVDGTKKKKKKKKNEKNGNEQCTSKLAGKTKAEDDQEFLVNYILNRGWIDRSSKRLPTYDEVTQSKSKTGKAKAQESENVAGSEPGEEAADDEEEIFDDIVDRFESSYNFRFEEADGSEIKSYPRNLPSVVRREDTTRKDARERRKQRKAEELAMRKEEVKRLKGLKMKELRARLERAGVATGEAESLKDLGIDLDAPWDPEAHDSQMAGLYFNGASEGDEFEHEEEEKPTWNDDVDISDLHMPTFPEARASKAEKKKKRKKEHEDDGQGVDVDMMDADMVPVDGDDDEEWDGTEEMRKRKLKEWMDEVYGLDFNDLVGGMPTRFHYTSVAPQNYALEPVEILLAKDSELNEYMGIKKYAPYRTENKSGWDSNRGERLRGLKDKLKERRSELAEEEPSRDRQIKKKRKGKKERMKEKGLADVSETATEINGAEDPSFKHKRDAEDTDGDYVDAGPSTEGGKKKRRRKKKDLTVEA